MIGQSTTRVHKFSAPVMLSDVALGATSLVTATTTLTLKTRAYDDFSAGVDDWVNVRGRLTTTGGASPDITAETSIFDPLSYVIGAAGYHRTQMLTDNIRTKITVPDGTIINGGAYFWFCGDQAMTHYYAIGVFTVLGISTLYIVKGTSPNSVQILASAGVSLTEGDSIEGWYDRSNDTIRMYLNGVSEGTAPMSPTDIPHGPGRRWCGVIMAPDWWIAPGNNFADFETWDV